MSARTDVLDPQLAASAPQQYPPLPATTTPTAQQQQQQQQQHQQAPLPPPGFGGQQHQQHQQQQHSQLQQQQHAHQNLNEGFHQPQQHKQHQQHQNPAYAQQTPQPYYYGPPQPHPPGSASSQSGQPSPADHAFAHALSGGEQQQQSPMQPHALDAQGNPDDPKRPRACEACRGLKVRCDQDPAHPDIPCKRCAKAGRPCLITQPSRKRQKKADSRVAELEKKLDALTAVLHQTQGGPGQYGSPSQVAPMADMLQNRASMASAPQYPPPMGYSAAPPDPGRAATDMGMPPQKRRRTEDHTEDTLVEALSSSNENIQEALDRLKAQTQAPSRDTTTPTQTQNEFHVIQQAWLPTVDARRYLFNTTLEEFTNRINTLVPPEQGSALFDRYVNELTTHMPAVVFPPGTTSEQVFREKPILYLSILSASCYGYLAPETVKELTNEATGAIADCVVRNGAKSIELIQAMQVMTLWYRPPEQTEQTNFYQIMHMAAVMALDIGLGKRYNPSKGRRPIVGKGGPANNAANVSVAFKPQLQDSDTLEARRAWLGCYYLCASASMVLRRPNLIRWTNYMTECIEILETSPEAFASDKLFCQHVEIQHICEEIGLQFLMDDNTAQISITDPKVTYALNVLENQLKQWKEKLPEDCRTPAMTFFEHVTSLYLHEIALHFNHNVEDFRLPFTEDSLKNVTNPSDTLTSNQIAAIDACMKAAHGILDTFLGLDFSTVLSLPMLLFFVRCVYAIVILIKMHVAVSAVNSELGKMIKPEDLNVEYYLDGLMNLFSRVVIERQTRPEKVLRILTVLRDWFGRHKETVAAQQRGEAPAQPDQGVKQEHGGTYGQTPLHMLSQVATGHQQGGGAPNPHTDWTFNAPTVMNYNNPVPPHHPDSKLPVNQQGDNQNPYNVPGLDTRAYPVGHQADMQGMLDPTNPQQDYGWGSGFEQAMNIALGEMDGLQGGSIDNWFLGESLAPFGFADMGASSMAAGGNGGNAGQW